MKVLVIRFSSIGDIVLTSPIVRCLKNQLKAEIHFLTKESYKDLLTNNPNITKIHCIKASTKEIIEELKKEKFDFIIDLHKNTRSRQIKRALGIPSDTFPKLNVKKWIYTNLKINRMPDKHIVDRYFEAVTSLEVANDQEGLDFFYDKINLIERPFSGKYISISFGAQHFTKRIPIEKLRELFKLYSGNIALLGGREDAETGKILANEFPHIKNYCGSCTVAQSAGLISESELFIGPDSGLMHIAAALGKRTFSIWGNTVPDFGMYPYYGKKDPGGNIKFEVKDLSCRPCSKLGHQACPKKHFRCMIDQNIAALVSSIEKSL